MTRFVPTVVVRALNKGLYPTPSHGELLVNLPYILDLHHLGVLLQLIDIDQLQ
jgi:hypothetical protein